MHSDVIDFFHEKAHAYSQGQLKYVSNLFVAPCEFKIGSEKLSFETNSQIETVLKAYRDNLLEQDYDVTKALVEHSSKTSDDKYYALVTYKNFSRDNQLLSTEYVSYLLGQDRECKLRILSTEYIDDPKPHLFRGVEQFFETEIT